MVSKKSADIINKLNIPILIYEYQKEHTCISAKISPVLYHGDNWRVEFSTVCQDPYDGYKLKQIYIEREFNPVTDELFIENNIRHWIEELLDFSDKIQNKEKRLLNKEVKQYE